MNKHKSVVIIPARYDSSRLQGKLILQEVKDITGRYIIEHVYQNVKSARGIEKVIVTTDSRQIFDIVKGFGGVAEMTSGEYHSGTDRISEIAERIDADFIVNVQGDEPEMNGAMVDLVIDVLEKDDNAVMSTLANRIENAEALRDPNCVKVVLDNNGYALYFSRSQIPYVRDNDEQGNGREFLRHLGIYGYRRDFLLKYRNLLPSKLEMAEKLEQLRALSNGYKIKVAITEYVSCGINTKNDLMEFIERHKND
ncbi:3-deoxy-manno-octulosonate cytidylyltransferase [Candidatus Kuenenia stuttgartiensis]|uniref:3-deoxy-manno-octulosonate cytidylyltransferase n=1 Tax=Kuenenia stuttgartiensis TaxID=174633 RepID=A0A6G7GKD3_KUEST|nr:3-deoxy-manno-octulosonate cytidylyltransferase [Candidatus Kuenenia stuttgartiensis]QII09985.1 3-deoxy-manno-octulosonate cytidylyltransferase [Candidatus Kuenenia stuttgartiensis]